MPIPNQSKKTKDVVTVDELGRVVLSRQLREELGIAIKDKLAVIIDKERRSITLNIIKN